MAGRTLGRTFTLDEEAGGETTDTGDVLDINTYEAVVRLQTEKEESGSVQGAHFMRKAWQLKVQRMVPKPLLEACQAWIGEELKQRNDKGGEEVASFRYLCGL